MRHQFKVRFNPQVYKDINHILDYYLEETKSDKLGKRFVKTLQSRFRSLNRSALLYQIRYDDVRFLPVTPFSFMAHYRVDTRNEIVNVEAIFHTSENPEGWK